MSERFDITNQHPPQEQFLLFVDGELESKEAAHCTAHLDSCWACRVQVGKIEDTITEIVEFEQALVEYDRARSGDRWNDFNGRLMALAASSAPPRRSWLLGGIFDRVQKFGPFARSIAWGAPAIAALLIAAIFLQSFFVSPVSAARVLRQAEAADAERSRLVESPVIYRKVRVSTPERAEIVEFWTEASGLRGKSTSEGKVETFDLRNILAESGFVYDRPLSPTGHRLWSERAGNRAVLETDIVLEDGRLGFRVTTSAETEPEKQTLLRASITIRDSDDHPVRETFVVRTGNETKTYTVEELAFKVISRKALGNDFFESERRELAVSNSRTSEVVNANNANTNTSEKGPLAEIATESVETASTELEVDILAELGRIRADLGEEITVARRGGALIVSGVVDSDVRKNEILSALAPYAANRSLRIDISTVAEAVAKQKTTEERKPQEIENIATGSAASPAESELVARLGSEAEARRFSARVVGRSREAMSHVYALRRLSRQFTASQVRELSPAARAKWAALIRSHAMSFRAASGEFSREIAAVFGGAQLGEPPANKVSEPEELMRRIEDLFGVASRNDRAIRTALTLSANGRQEAGFGDRGFWNSIRSADSIAAAIAEFR